MQNVDYVQIDSFWFTPYLKAVVYCGANPVNGVALADRSSSVQVFTGDSYKGDTFAGIKVTKDQSKCTQMQFADAILLYVRKYNILVIVSTTIAVIVGVLFITFLITKYLTSKEEYEEIQ